MTTSSLTATSVLSEEQAVTDDLDELLVSLLTREGDGGVLRKLLFTKDTLNEVFYLLLINRIPDDIECEPDALEEKLAEFLNKFRNRLSSFYVKTFADIADFEEGVNELSEEADPS